MPTSVISMLEAEPVARRILRLCIGCAQSFYDTVPPSDQYAVRVAKLLFGTAIQESNLIWERQRLQNQDSSIGGYSKWQLEAASIQASLSDFQKRPGLMQQTTKWLFNDSLARPTWITGISTLSILWSMRLDDNDKIGVWFARAHYRRVSEPVPSSIEDIAAYWKKYYNTSAGKGTVEQFLTNYRAVCDKENLSCL